MTTAQHDQLTRSRREAQAAGTTLTHYLTEDGYVVLTDIDQDGTEGVAAIWPDGSLHL